MSGQLQKTQDAIRQAQGLVKKAADEMLEGMSESEKARMKRIFCSSISKNPKIAFCNPATMLGAFQVSGVLRLEPNTPLGHCYIIPYGKEATFQMGYKGLITLCYRNDRVRGIYAEVVYENDEFRRELGLSKNLIHVPALEDRGEPIGYYGVLRLTDADPLWEYMTKEEVEAHAARFSQSFKGGKDSPWKTDFDSMALKTVLIKALRYAPMSISDEVAKATAIDEATDRGMSPTDFGLDPITVDDYSISDVDDEEDEPEEKKKPAKKKAAAKDKKPGESTGQGMSEEEFLRQEAEREEAEEAERQKQEELV